MKSLESEYKTAVEYIQQDDIKSLRQTLERSIFINREDIHPDFNLLNFSVKNRKFYSTIFLINQGIITKDLTQQLSELLLSVELYLYNDRQGNFQFSFVYPTSEEVGDYCSPIKSLSTGEGLEIFYKFLDKYIYRKIRHQKFDRDISLGKEDVHTLQNRDQSLRNLKLLQTALAIIYPAVHWKIGRLVSLYDMPIEDLEGWLINQEQKTMRHYGDSFSDDSDSDDEKENFSTPKKKNFERIRGLSSSESFQKKTRQRTPGSARKAGYAGKNAGLEGKLCALVELIKKEKIKEDKTKVAHLEGILGKLKSGPSTSSVRGEDGKVSTGLRERARIPALQSEISVIEKINAQLQEIVERQGNIQSEQLREIISQSAKKIFIAQYRGLNYMIDRWNANSRRYHRTIDETGGNQTERDIKSKGAAQYSEMVLKTLPYCFYTELDAKNDYTRVPKYQFDLSNTAKKIGEFFQELEYRGPCLDYTDESKQQPYYFNSISDRLQHRFSNGIDSHLEHLQSLRLDQSDSYWREFLPSAHNPSIATGDIPYHALKYAYGLKAYYLYPLRPRYSYQSGNLFAEYMHAGKFYVSLHELSEILANDSVKRVSHLDRHGRVVILRDIAYEKESSFIGSLPDGKVFYQFVAKFPSFRGRYKAIYQVKYGFSQNLYEAFQYLLQNSSPSHSYRLSKFEDNLRDKIIELLSEWLCSYHEVLLLEIAAERARSQGGILVYLNHDNMLSFFPDKNLFTSGRNNEQIRVETHIHRALRRVIARRHLAWEMKGVPFHGFKLEEYSWVKSQLEEMYYNPSALEDIVVEAKQAVTEMNINIARNIIENDLEILQQNSDQYSTFDQLDHKDEMKELSDVSSIEKLIAACEQGDEETVADIVEDDVAFGVSTEEKMRLLGAAIWGMSLEVVSLIWDAIEDPPIITWEEWVRYNHKIYGRTNLISDFSPRTYKEWYSLIEILQSNSSFLSAIHLETLDGLEGWESFDDIAMLSDEVGMRAIGIIDNPDEEVDESEDDESEEGGDIVVPSLIRDAFEETQERLHHCLNEIKDFIILKNSEQSTEVQEDEASLGEAFSKWTPFVDRSFSRLETPLTVAPSFFAPLSTQIVRVIQGGVSNRLHNLYQQYQEALIKSEQEEEKQGIQLREIRQSIKEELTRIYFISNSDLLLKRLKELEESEKSPIEELELEILKEIIEEKGLKLKAAAEPQSFALSRDFEPDAPDLVTGKISDSDEIKENHLRIMKNKLKKLEEKDEKRSKDENEDYHKLLKKIGQLTIEENSSVSKNDRHEPLLPSTFSIEETSLEQVENSIDSDATSPEASLIMAEKIRESFPTIEFKQELVPLVSDDKRLFAANKSLSKYRLCLVNGYSEGDCFFDSVMVGMPNEITKLGWISRLDRIKWLRVQCKNFIFNLEESFSEQDVREEKVASWIQESLIWRDRDITYEKYIKNVEHSVRDIGCDGVQYTDITWGYPEIDGVIICNQFKIKIHIVTVGDNGELIHRIIMDDEEAKKMQSDDLSDPSISPNIFIFDPEKIDYKDKKIIHIATADMKHFTPLKSISLNPSLAKNPFKFSYSSLSDELSVTSTLNLTAGL